MSSHGYILLHRSLIDHPLFAREVFTEWQAWIWMLMRASFEPHEMRIRGTHKVVKVSRGQLVTANRVLSETWGWSVNRVRRFLELLKNEAMIDTQPDTHHTIITICNYDRFQSKLTKTDTPIDTDLNTQADTVTDTQANTRINNIKNLNKEKKDILVKRKNPSEELGGFEQFWQAYPKKVKKKRAQELYLKVTSANQATDDQILKGLSAYLQSREVKSGYISDPTTWLNGERWNDEISAANDPGVIETLQSDDYIKSCFQTLRSGGTLLAQAKSYLETKLGKDWQKYVNAN